MSRIKGSKRVPEGTKLYAIRYQSPAFTLFNPDSLVVEQIKTIRPGVKYYKTIDDAQATLKKIREVVFEPLAALPDNPD